MDEKSPMNEDYDVNAGDDTADELEESVDPSYEDNGDDEEDAKAEEDAEAISGDDDEDGGDSDGVTREEELEAKVEELEDKLKRAGKKIAKSRVKSKKAKQEVKEEGLEQNDALLARIENRGYTDRDQQKELIKMSKRMNVHPIDLLDDSDLGEMAKAKLDGIKKRKQNAKAVARSTGRAASKTVNKVDAMKKDFEKTGKLPDPLKDPEAFDKLNEQLIKDSEYRTARG